VTDTAFSRQLRYGNFRRGWLGQGARPVLPPDLAPGFLPAKMDLFQTKFAGIYIAA
jgi:hypothetical protein